MNQKNLAKMFFEKSTSQQILKALGIKEDHDDLEPKLSIRYKPVNEAQRKDINYKYSKHAMQI